VTPILSIKEESKKPKYLQKVVQKLCPSPIISIKEESKKPKSLRKVVQNVCPSIYIY
jgi:N6-adenosine-specific RNA methylase IME4